MECYQGYISFNPSSIYQTYPVIWRLHSVIVPAKLLTAIVVMTALVVSTLSLARSSEVLTHSEYAAGLVIGEAIILCFLAWKRLQAAPSSFATSSEKSLPIAESVDRVCHATPKVVSDNRWKLEEADLNKGHFRARIGMSLHTFSSTFLIDVAPADENSVNVHVFCGTRSSNDPDHNDRMISKFFAGLGDALRDTT